MLDVILPLPDNHLPGVFVSTQMKLTMPEEILDADLPELKHIERELAKEGYVLADEFEIRRK